MAGSEASPHGERSVVVGVDGSRHCLDAAVWAAREADRRGLRLRLVEVVEWQGVVAGHPEAVRAAAQVRSELRSIARRDVDRTAAHVDALLPDMPVSAEVCDGVPVDVLGEASEHAALLAIGRPVGGWGGTLLGVALAGRSACPLVFVNELPDAGPDDPVVVGVDGSPDSDAALEVAFAEARDRNVYLRVLHAWSDVPLDACADPAVEFGDFASGVRASVYERVAPYARRHPDVEVRHSTTRDHPERALRELSANAHLVVIGAGGRSGGLGLGQVSRRIVTTARCPVMVVGPRMRAGATAPAPEDVRVAD
ncbi:universal stress protein [Pseudonocardia benzenivorans]|uniref:UspA domain-containing protein n=3 Tax=Pseudonocardia TaxID=1847 RepID=F4CKK0_PSEUX|nr:universal stress protein [Pseudonocardia dioxanivorans]AEA22970.1 UspA domain-containing protein [Pseudonocardia dioxanivorans CB1190]